MISGIGLLVLMLLIFAPDLFIMPFAMAFSFILGVINKIERALGWGRPCPRDDGEDGR